MISDQTKVKVNEQRLENCVIKFFDYANMVLDTTIVFLGSIVRELCKIFEIWDNGGLLHDARITNPMTPSDSLTMKTYI